LKSTLSELEKKISKAKKQLNTYKNIISEEESDEENEQQVNIAVKNPNCFEEISTTIASSQSKIHFFKAEADFTSLQKLKTYYLSHLAQALEGKDHRALDHLIVSHKVLRNYYKIESTSFSDIEEKKVNLPRAKADLNKKTLILDIDETIIHCEEDPSKPYDIMLPIEIENGSTA
jgi:CTD small phosphatase-like protein 2